MATLQQACPEVSEFKLTVNHPQGVYYAGQHVTGHVTLNLKLPLTLHGLQLRFIGGCNTEWRQLIRQGNCDGESTIEGSEIYFDHYVLLWGRDSMDGDGGGLEPVMEPCDYTFPFDFHLPRNIPSSVEAEYGKVRYSLEAILERPWSSNVKSFMTYTVINNTDLNEDEALAKAQKMEGQRTPGLISFLSEPIAAWLGTDKKGYVAGQFILLSGEVVNNSGKKVKNCTISLNVQFTFTGQRRGTRFVYQTSTTARLCSLAKGCVSANGGTQTWDGDRLQVPAAPPSRLHCCNLIDVAYTVELAIYTKKSRPYFTIPIGITIGTVPLRTPRERQPTADSAVAAIAVGGGHASQSCAKYRAGADNSDVKHGE